MPHISDDLFLGAAEIGGLFTSAGPSMMTKGFGPVGRTYVFDVVPTVLDADGIAAAQAIAGAANAVINGALASGGRAVLDCARGLQMVSDAAGDTTQTVTVTGIDIYGQVMSEARTLNGTTPVLFLKAFKTVTAVGVSAVLAGNITVGTRDAIGLPARMVDRTYIIHQGWNNTLARDAGVPTVADVTSPATTTTGDVRGTIALSSAADGAKRLVVAIALTALQVGPSATRVGAVGVPQV